MVGRRPARAPGRYLPVNGEGVAALEELPDPYARRRPRDEPAVPDEIARQVARLGVTCELVALEGAPSA